MLKFSAIVTPSKLTTGNNAMNNTIPKSLHTVTVLVAFAKALYATSNGYTMQECLTHAVAQLGYSDTPDNYALITQALKKINK